MGPRANAKESFYYSVDALLELDYYKKQPEQAVTEGYIKDEQGNFIQNPNQEAIANHKYDSTNGNNTPGDGWLFAGRGLFHTTGRYNYNRLTKLYQRFFGEAQDFELHPELLEEPKYSVRAAVVFWLDHKMYRIADQGIDQETFNKIRKVINPGEGKDRKQQQWEMCRHFGTRARSTMSASFRSADRVLTLNDAVSGHSNGVCAGHL